MSPATKSIICALVLAVIVGFAVTFLAQQAVGSFAAGIAFVVGLILFGMLFKVPPRSNAPQ